MLVALGEKEIKTRDDLADLASDELLEILPAKSLNEEQANTVIMAARAHWFEGEEAESTDSKDSKDSNDAQAQDPAEENV